MYSLAARFRFLWPTLGLLALLFGAAWIEPLLAHRSFPRTIVIGGHDLGLAQGWSAKELSETLPGTHGPVTAVYRWSGASSSLVFAPATQGQPHLVTLRLLSGRADDQPIAPVRLSANGQPLAEFAVAPVLRRYQVYVPGGLAGQSLTLRLDTPTFIPPDDGRVLGLIGLEARAEEVGAIVWRPRPTLPLLLLGLLALLMLNGLPLARAVAAVAFALAAALASGLVAPTETLAAARTLAQLLLIAAVVVGVVQWLRRRGVDGHEAGDSRRPGRGWRWAAAIMLLLTVLLFTPGMSADGVEYYAYVRSLAVDHDIEFTNEFKGPEVPFERVPEWLATNRSPTGYAQNLASVGPAIVWAPFYLLGSLIVRAGNAFGADWTTDGYSLPYIAMINLASAVSLPITAWLCYLIARRVTNHGVALLASVALVAGSAIIDYGLFEAHYPHALAAMTVAAYFYWWLRTRPERRLGQWAVLGLLAGAMALMYWINVILLLLPALDLLPPFVRALRARDWRAIGVMFGSGLIFLAALLLAFSPQMIAWTILYGSPFTIPHGSSFAEPHGFKALQMLFSPVHGQLLWAPITFVAMLGMGWYIARRRWEGALVLLAFGLYFLYNATLGSWHGGGPFGLRRIVNVLPLLAPGLACLLSWMHEFRTNGVDAAMAGGDMTRVMPHRASGQLVVERERAVGEQLAVRRQETGDGRQETGDRRQATGDRSQVSGLGSAVRRSSVVGRRSSVVAMWPLTLCALCLGWSAALLLRYLGYLIPHHPGELGTLSVSEFVLAPNNLPWYKLPQIVGAALFPRLLIQGASNPAGGEWVPFGLLLGATVLVVLAVVAALAWLHGRATGTPRAGAGRRVERLRPSGV
jgi:hypothetical protein